MSFYDELNAKDSNLEIECSVVIGAHTQQMSQFAMKMVGYVEMCHFNHDPFIQEQMEDACRILTSTSEVLLSIWNKKKN